MSVCKYYQRPQTMTKAVSKRENRCAEPLVLATEFMVVGGLSVCVNEPNYSNFSDANRL